MAEEQRNSSKIFTSSPEGVVDTSVCTNSSITARPEVEDGILDSQDQELLDILEELQTADPNVPSERLSTSGTTQIIGYFFSDTDLSNKVSTDIEIKVLEKGLDFAPIQRINEPEQRQDFADFCGLIRIKWFFRNEPTTQFSKIPGFPPGLLGNLQRIT